MELRFKTETTSEFWEVVRQVKSKGFMIRKYRSDCSGTVDAQIKTHVLTVDKPDWMIQEA